MIRLFRQVFGPTQQELIDVAFAKCAEAEAEAAKCSALIDLYDQLLARIDHDTAWWDFAAAKQARADAIMSYKEAFAVQERTRQQAMSLVESYKGAGQ